MFSCNDIDAILMDWLYDELEPGKKARFAEHSESCARCQAEIAALQATRATLRTLPAEEPPAALSAMLLHEAHRHAAAEERPGLWAWFSNLLQPLMTHPAATALATLVLVVGVAGALALRGGLHVREQTRTGAQPALAEQAPAPAAATPVAPQQGTGAAGAAGEEATLDNISASDDDIDIPAEAPAGGTYSDQGEAAGDTTLPPATVTVRTEEPALKDLAEKPSTDRSALDDRITTRKQESTARTRSKAGKRDELANAISGADLESEVTSEGMASSQRRAVAREDTRDDDFGSAVAQKDKSKPSPPANVAPAKKPAESAAGERGGRVGSGGGTASPGSTTSAGPGASPKAPARAPAPEPQAPADETDGTNSSRDEVVAKNKKAAEEAQKVGNSWAAGKQRELTRAASEKRCSDAARIANDILDRDPGYYRANVQGSRALATCKEYGAKEQKRRASERARSKKARASDAAEVAE